MRALRAIHALEPDDQEQMLKALETLWEDASEFSETEFGREKAHEAWLNYRNHIRHGANPTTLRKRDYIDGYMQGAHDRAIATHYSEAALSLRREFLYRMRTVAAYAFMRGKRQELMEPHFIEEQATYAMCSSAVKDVLENRVE